MICSADNLVKNYGADPVLDHVSLVINEKEKWGIVGVNGAGKSTFAGCLCGIRKHTGKVFYGRTERNAKKRLKESFIAAALIIP